MDRERISKNQILRIYCIIRTAVFKHKSNHRTPQLISSNSHCLLPGKGRVSSPGPGYPPDAHRTTGAGNVRGQASCPAGPESLEELQPRSKQKGRASASFTIDISISSTLLNNQAATWACHVHALVPDNVLSRTKIPLLF